jgi:hypothetical protein
MFNAFQCITAKVFVLAFSVVLSINVGAMPDTLRLKPVLNTQVAISGLSFAAVGNLAFIQYKNADSVYRLLVNENGMPQMQSTLPIPAAKNGNLAQVEKQMDKPALLQTPIFNELGSISDSVCYTRFYANKAYNSIFYEKVNTIGKTITQGSVAGLAKDEKLVSVFEAGQYFLAIVQKKEASNSMPTTYWLYRFDVHGNVRSKEIDLWRTGFFEFKYDIQDCFLLCQESGFRTDNAITIPPTNYQPGFVIDNNYLYFYAFHKSQLFVQQIDILTSQVTQQVFSLSTYFSGIAYKSKYSLTISGRNMLLLKYDEQSLAFAEVDIYKENAVARRLLTYLDLQGLEYFYVRNNNGSPETGTELINTEWFNGFKMKKPVISMRATDNGDSIITIGLTKMKEVNKFARNFGNFLTGFSVGYFGSFTVWVVTNQPNINTGIDAKEQSVEVFDFKLQGNYFYPAPNELKKRKIVFDKEKNNGSANVFQPIQLNNGKVLVLSLQ